MLTNLQLAEFVSKAFKAKWVYWYGTYGLPCTKSLYSSKKNQYPSHYGSSRTTKYMKQISEGRWCADCIGLGKGFVWSNGQFETKPKYGSNGCPDKSADGMFSYAKSKGLSYGTISTIPEIPGLAVRMSGHVGYYIGGGYVIEERGFDYGCVKTKLKDRKWTDWYEFPGVTYVSEKPNDPQTTEPEPEPKPEPTDNSSVKVTNGNYYVRTGPSTSYSSVGVVRNGEYYPYLGVTKNGWYNIECDGRSLWVSAKCGKIVNEKSPEVVNAPIEPSKVYYTVASGSWNVRKGPSVLHKSLGIVKGGEKLEYLGETKNKWYKVKSSKYEGWISQKGVKK